MELMISNEEQMTPHLFAEESFRKKKKRRGDGDHDTRVVCYYCCVHFILG